MENVAEIIPDKPSDKGIRFHLSGSDPILMVKKLLWQRIPGSADLPSQVSINGVPQTVNAQWLDGFHSHEQARLVADWANGGRITVCMPSMVSVTTRLYPFSPSQLLTILENIPFSVGSVDGCFPKELQEFSGTVDEAPNFDEDLFPVGWACFFKGEGHRRLVSRRWLEFGPWRVMHGENDVTLVQFCDLEADADSALGQSRVGHPLLGNAKTHHGGLLPKYFRLQKEHQGNYHPEQRILEIFVQGRKISKDEMFEACAIRSHQSLGPSRPLNNIRYVFSSENEARAHLHELWLRELECWTLIDGRLLRIDTDYHPQPLPPRWVWKIHRQSRPNSFEGTPQQMMQITLERLDRDIRSYQEIDHRYQGEITDQKDLDQSVKIMRNLCWDLRGLVGIKDLEAWVGPLTAEEHFHFKTQLQERLAILGSTHRITVFMYWTMSLADSLNEDYELYKLCMDRSIIQLLLDEYALPATSKWITAEDLAELDADIRKTIQYFESIDSSIDPSMIPDGLPVSHWWWRHPEKSNDGNHAFHKACH